MALDVISLALWHSPQDKLYGSGNGNVSDGAGMLELDHLTLVRQQISPQLTSSKSIICILIKNFSLTLKSGEAAGVTRIAFAGNVNATGPVKLILETLSVNATTYRFRLTDDDGLGDTDSTNTFTYGHGNQYDLRLITDGTNWILDVNGVEEIKLADTRKIITTGAVAIALRADGSADSGNSQTRSEGFAHVAYDSGSDRPSADFGGAELTLAGESATHQDYDQGTGAASPSRENVDDFEGGIQDDDDTEDHFVAAVDVTKLQAYTTVNFTIGSGTRQQAVRISGRQRSSVGGKFAIGNIFMFDGTDIEHGPATIPGSAWGFVFRLFRLAPSTNAWDQTAINNIELGHRGITSVDFSAEHVEITAIHGEIIDLLNDPPTVEGLPERSYPRGVGRGVMRGVA